ncbi:hypothetical protein, partial [Dyella sp.]|uniref:hypothetical protein n=1 Tax=Dyella sp. TaxID=1869338 RepID=UPI002B4815B2
IRSAHPFRGRPFGRSPRFALRPAFAGTTSFLAISLKQAKLSPDSDGLSPECRFALQWRQREP